MAQTVKRLSAVLETWVRSLGWEYPLEKETATHSSTLAWKIPWTEEPGRPQSMGSQRVRHDEWLYFYFSGNPDSCWCLTGSNFALTWLSLCHAASQEAYRRLEILPNLHGKFGQNLDFTPDGPWTGMVLAFVKKEPFKYHERAASVPSVPRSWHLGQLSLGPGNSLHWKHSLLCCPFLVQPMVPGPQWSCC